MGFPFDIQKALAFLFPDRAKPLIKPSDLPKEDVSTNKNNEVMPEKYDWSTLKL